MGKNKAKTAISVAIEAKPEVEIEGHPESPRLNVPSMVSTSVLMPDLTCYSDLGDDPAPTDTGMMEATGIHTQPIPTLTPQDTNVVEFGEAIKNPAYHISQTEYSGCLDISAHA